VDAVLFYYIYYFAVRCRQGFTVYLFSILVLQMKQRKFKQIILRVVLFLSILFALDRSIGLILLKLGDNIRNTGSFGMVNKTLNSGADVFILGSSRALHHYDCDIIGKHLEKKVYNAARGGQGLLYSRLMVDLILEKSAPDLFILQIEPQNLMTGVYREQSLAIASSAPFLDRSEKSKEVLFSASRWHRIKHMSHAFRFNGQLLFFISDLIKKDSFANGYVPINKTTNLAELDRRQYTIVRSPATSPCQAALDNLRELIRVIHGKGAKVVMVSSPRWRKTHLMPEVYYEIAKSIEEIASEENVPYIKILQETHPVFNDPSLFADSAHLNVKGATVFSEIVAEIITPEQRE
jgi:hypothetical protein